jgi:hypothetical protein
MRTTFTTAEHGFEGVILKVPAHHIELAAAGRSAGSYVGMDRRMMEK